MQQQDIENVIAKAREEFLRALSQADRAMKAVVSNSPDQGAAIATLQQLGREAIQFDAGLAPGANLVALQQPAA